MHSLLENYLTEVRAKLSALPVKRREEEMREMRQHLLDAVIVNRELGQSEDEAAASTVEQCGAPGKAAHGLVQAWQRGKVADQRSFLGGTVCAMVLSYLLPRMLESLLVQSSIFSFIRLLSSHGIVDVPVTLNYTAHALAGGISGLIFGRQAAAGTTLAAAIWYGVPIVRVLSGSEWVSSPAVWTFQYLSFALLAVIAAWIMSRLRRKTLVRAAAVAE